MNSFRTDVSFGAHSHLTVNPFSRNDSELIQNPFILLRIHSELIQELGVVQNSLALHSELIQHFFRMHSE